LVSSLRLVALRASSATVVRPTGAESSEVSFAYFSTTGAKAGSSSTDASTGMTSQSMDSTLPVAGSMLRSMRPSSRASAVILKMGTPADEDCKSVCSCPPMMTSMPGAQRASALSCASERCVSATTACAPAARICGMTARAVSHGSRNSVVGSGFEVVFVSGRVRPRSPTLTPPSSRTSKSGVSPKVFPEVALTTLAPSHLNFDSFMRLSSSASP
jgi:hypothetical protein